MKNHMTFPSSDGKTKLHAVIWIPETEPRAILQIAHGMVEHPARYDELATFLTDHRIAVYGIYHIGHGPDAVILNHILFQNMKSGFI